MLDKGVYVVGFCYPVVPKGRDRVRTQISAGHTKEDLDFAVKCFAEVRAEMGIYGSVNKDKKEEGKPG